MTNRRARTHHAPGDSRRSRAHSPTRLPTVRSASLRRLGSAAPSTRRAQRKPRSTKPFHHRRRSRPGRGRAEGQGRASPCLPPAPGSPSRRLSARRSARRRGACAHGSRCRAPRPPPKSCASTPTQPRCVTSASPSATRSGLRRTSLSLWRDGAEPAAQPRPKPDSRCSGAAGPGCGPERPRSQPEGLRRGGRSGFGGRKGRRPGVLRPPGRPSGRIRNSRPLGVRHGHRHPAALAAARAADRCENPGSDPALAGRRPTTKAGRPSLAKRRRRRDRARRRLRPRPRRRSSRRSNTLIAVAPKLRSKPAQKIVDLLLAQDCVSPAEAARHAPMTGRAARRLFDRLVVLGAAREFSGRPTFRLYGL